MEKSRNAVGLELFRNSAWLTGLKEQQVSVPIRNK